MTIRFRSSFYLLLFSMQTGLFSHSSFAGGADPAAPVLSGSEADRSLNLEDNPGGNCHRCAHCSFSTQFRSNLRRHQRVHTGEKPYRCKRTGCAATFARKSALIEHDREHEASTVSPDRMFTAPIIRPHPVRVYGGIDLARRVDHLLARCSGNELNNQADLQGLINQIDELIYSCSRVSSNVSQFFLGRLLLKKCLLEMSLGNRFEAENLLRVVRQLKAYQRVGIGEQGKSEVQDVEINVFDFIIGLLPQPEQIEILSLEVRESALHSSSSPNSQENLSKDVQVQATVLALSGASPTELAPHGAELDQLKRLLQTSRQKYKNYRSKYHEVQSSFLDYQKGHETSKIALELRHKKECDELIARATAKHQLDLNQLRSELEVKFQSEKMKLEEKLETEYRSKLEILLMSCKEENRKECFKIRSFCEEQSREALRNLDKTFQLKLEKLSRVIDSQRKRLHSLTQFQNAVDVIGNACSTALNPLNDVFVSMKSILELAQKNIVQNAESPLPRAANEGVSLLSGIEESKSND